MHHFFAYLSRMRFIQRWGLMRNTLPENDMEHACQTAMIAHALALTGNVRYGRAYDENRVMALALYHDAPEVLTGDLPTPVKHGNPAMRAEYGKIEAMAARQLLSMLPEDLRKSYAPLIEHDESTAEWRLVKAADRICAYLKCVEERKAGNSEFTQAQESVARSIAAIDLPEVCDFMRDMAPGFGMSLDEIAP